MGSCPGCLPTGKELAQQYETTKAKAIALMNENKFDVAIYRTEEGFGYIKADVATANNYPIREILMFSE